MLRPLLSSTYLRPIQVSFEQPVQECPGKFRIIVDLLVELKMSINHVLEQVCDEVVEAQACIFRWIDTYAGFQRCITGEALFNFVDTQLIIVGKIGAKLHPDICHA